MDSIEVLKETNEVFHNRRSEILDRIVILASRTSRDQNGIEKAINELCEVKHDIVEAFTENFMWNGGAKEPNNVLRNISVCENFEFLKSIGAIEVWIHRETQYKIPQNVFDLKISDHPVVNKNIGTVDLGILTKFHYKLTKIIYSKNKTVKNTLTELHYLMQNLKTSIKLYNRYTKELKEDDERNKEYKSSLQLIKGLNYMFSTIENTLNEWNKKLKA